MKLVLFSCGPATKSSLDQLDGSFLRLDEAFELGCFLPGCLGLPSRGLPRLGHRPLSTFLHKWRYAQQVLRIELTLLGCRTRSCYLICLCHVLGSLLCLVPANSGGDHRGCLIHWVVLAPVP